MIWAGVSSSVTPTMWAMRWRVTRPRPWASSPLPRPDERFDSGLVGPSWNPGEGVDYRFGHRVGRCAECVEEAQDRADVDPGVQRVDGELK